MSQSFKVFVGDRLPDFHRPLLIVTIVELEEGYTAIEQYLLLPESGGKNGELIQKIEIYRHLFSKVPKEVLSADSALESAVELSTALVLEKIWISDRYQNFMKPDHSGDYRFTEVDAHKIFHYKWHCGLEEEISKVRGATNDDALRDYLRFVESVTLQRD